MAAKRENCAMTTGTWRRWRHDGEGKMNDRCDDIYMQRQVKAVQARAERAEMRQRLKREMDEWTPRAQRAHRHGNMMLAMFSKFIPDACRPDALEEAMLNFFAQDFEVVPVPPERDAQLKMKLKAAAMTGIVPPIIISVKLKP